MIYRVMLLMTSYANHKYGVKWSSILYQLKKDTLQVCPFVVLLPSKKATMNRNL